VNRLRAEADRPVADVFWSSEIFQTIDLASEGVLEEHLSEATKDWPREWRDGQRRWHAFAARARVIAYSPTRVASDDVPISWFDVTNPKWKGRVVMADPRFGTTGGHLGAMKAYWSALADDGPTYEQFLDGLKANDIRVLASGNAGVVEAIACGEADLGMTDTDDVYAAQERGLKVEMIFPRHHPDPSAQGDGTLLIPNTVARVKGGPNPEGAKTLIDFLLSERVERMLAESPSRNFPLASGTLDHFPSVAAAKWLRVDWEQAAAMRREAVDEAVELLMNEAVAGDAGTTAP
jgi:iron(III) transport system substrate-binding protein